MEKVLRNLQDHPAVKVSVGSGTQHWRTGATTLTVGGDGKATVHNANAEGERTYTAALNRDRVQEFGRLLADHAFTRERTSEMPRQPGDVPVWFRIEDDDQVQYEANLWHADRYDDDDLDAILRYADDLTEEITDGVLPFGKNKA